MSWKTGPMPPDTWDWGGVVLKGEEAGYNFYFADFQGDHVVLVPDGRTIPASEIAFYDNSLKLPPGKTHRSK